MGQRFYSPSTRWFYLDAVHKTMPDDSKPISEELYQSLQGREFETGPDGMPREMPVQPPTFEQRQGRLLLAIDAFVNSTARALGYDDIRTAVTYADEPAVPKFQLEGQALRAWRSLVYAKCFEVLAEVRDGVAEELDEAALLAVLPPFVLPEQES